MLLLLILYSLSDPIALTRYTGSGHGPNEQGDTVEQAKTVERSTGTGAYLTYRQHRKYDCINPDN